MFKSIFGQRRTTKSDVVLAVAGAAMAVWKAFDTYNEFKAEKAEDEQLKEITQ